MQKLKALVDLQCKCVRLDTPNMGPIWGFLAVSQLKVFLEVLNLKKPTMCFSPKLNFRERHVLLFLKFKNFKNTFDYLTAGNPEIGPIFGVSSLTHLHCKSTKAFNLCIFLHSYVNAFIVWPIPNTKNMFLASKVVIWKLGGMGLEHILYLKVCHIRFSKNLMWILTIM